MSFSPDDCFHLTVALVEEIHAVAIEEFGGAGGLRDPVLLDSAVAAAQATFDGLSVYSDLVEVAGAYLFYICRNHPFVDGNKRTAMMAAITFLRLNDIEPAPDGTAWETLLVDVSSSLIDRDAATRRLRALIPQKRGAAKSRSPRRRK
jgi:death-on-curing protein